MENSYFTEDTKNQSSFSAVRNYSDVHESIDGNFMGFQPGLKSDTFFLLRGNKIIPIQFVANQMRKHPERPIVARAALTGIAASNINGHTLHSFLHIFFGNEHTSCGDEVRDHLRYTYQDLQLLIIDEISMVKPDLLYQVRKIIFDLD